MILGISRGTGVFGPVDRFGPNFIIRVHNYVIVTVTTTLRGVNTVFIQFQSDLQK